MKMISAAKRSRMLPSKGFEYEKALPNGWNLNRFGWHVGVTKSLIDGYIRSMVYETNYQYSVNAIVSIVFKYYNVIDTIAIYNPDTVHVSIKYPFENNNSLICGFDSWIGSTVLLKPMINDHKAHTINIKPIEDTCDECDTAFNIGMFCINKKISQQFNIATRIRNIDLLQFTSFRNEPNMIADDEWPNIKITFMNFVQTQKYCAIKTHKSSTERRPINGDWAARVVVNNTLFNSTSVDDRDLFTEINIILSPKKKQDGSVSGWYNLVCKFPNSKNKKDNSIGLGSNDFEMRLLRYDCYWAFSNVSSECDKCNTTKFAITYIS